jgi:hypothetical protein
MLVFWGISDVANGVGDFAGIAHFLVVYQLQ